MSDLHVDMNELSHTPEIYRPAAHAGFNVLISGHTHGGQICLPSDVPITLDSTLPRRLGLGPIMA
jgi:predicted MPP superfamily phosphohydrolase